MSERAAFNAAFEAWSAGAGSELWMEEDIKIIKKCFFKSILSLRVVGEGGGKGMSGRENLEKIGDYRQ